MITFLFMLPSLILLVFSVWMIVRHIRLHLASVRRLRRLRELGDIFMDPQVTPEAFKAALAELLEIKERMNKC